MIKNLTNLAFGKIFVAKYNKDAINKIGGNNLGDELDIYCAQSHSKPESVNSLVAKSNIYDATVLVLGTDPKIHIALSDNQSIIGFIILSNNLGQEMCKLIDNTLTYVKDINPIPKSCKDMINIIDQVLKEHINAKTK